MVVRLHSCCRGTCTCYCKGASKCLGWASQPDIKATVIPYLLFLLISRTAVEKAARAQCRGVQSCPRDKDAVCHTDRYHEAKGETKGGWLSKEAGTTLGIRETLTVKERSWSAGRRWLRITWTKSGLEGGSCWDLDPGTGVWWGKWWGKKQLWSQWGGWWRLGEELGRVSCHLAAKRGASHWYPLLKLFIMTDAGGQH